MEYPDADDLMFGRGMLIDPALVMRLRAKSADPAEKTLQRNCVWKIKAQSGRTRRSEYRISEILWAAGGGLRSGAVRGTGRTI